MTIFRSILKDFKNALSSSMTDAAQPDKVALIEAARENFTKLQTPGHCKTAQDVMTLHDLISVRLETAGAEISALIPGVRKTGGEHAVATQQANLLMAKAMQDRLGEVPPVKIESAPDAKKSGPRSTP